MATWKDFINKMYGHRAPIALSLGAAATLIQIYRQAQENKSRYARELEKDLGPRDSSGQAPSKKDKVAVNQEFYDRLAKLVKVCEWWLGAFGSLWLGGMSCSQLAPVDGALRLSCHRGPAKRHKCCIFTLHAS
jgi:hypothetical protein